MYNCNVHEDGGVNDHSGDVGDDGCLYLRCVRTKHSCLFTPKLN